MRRTREEVIALRQEWREARHTMMLNEFAQKHGVGRKKLSDLLYGRTHKDVPGALEPEETPVRKNPVRRGYLPEVVLFMRLQYNPPKVTSRHIAVHYKTTFNKICRILNGQYYADVPEACQDTKEWQGSGRVFTDAEVIKMRRQYRSGHVSIDELSVETGIRRPAMTNMLRGYSYKDVPEAVPFHIRKRRLKPWTSPEVKEQRRQRRYERARAAYHRRKAASSKSPSEGVD
jgi:hypothetical protein